MTDNWKVLHKIEQNRIMWNGGYTPINEMSPSKLDGLNIVYDSDIEKMLSIGDKLEILDTCGNIDFCTLTEFAGANGPQWGCIARNETGDHKGTEVYLDSSFFPRYNLGFKVLNKFPWEKEKASTLSQ